LSEQARKNIKETIKQKFTASKKSYDNLYGQYGNSIDKLTGRGNGKDFLVDYAISEPEQTQQQLQEITPDEEQELLNGGVSPETIQMMKSQSFNSVGNTTASIPKTSRLAYVNNNPGNLRFAGQDGAVNGEKGFAKFPTPEAGVRALQNQIKLDASRNLTLAQFINKYAPPTENNTSKYIQDVIKVTGARNSGNSTKNIKQINPL